MVHGTCFPLIVLSARPNHHDVDVRHGVAGFSVHLVRYPDFNNSTDILDPRDVEVASMAMACVFGHPFEIF